MFQEYLLVLSCLDSLVFSTVMFSCRSPWAVVPSDGAVPCPGLAPAPGAVVAEGLVLVLWLKNTLPWLRMRSDTTVLKVL